MCKCVACGKKNQVTKKQLRILEAGKPFIKVRCNRCKTQFLIELNLAGEFNSFKIKVG